MTAVGIALLKIFIHAEQIFNLKFELFQPHEIDMERSFQMKLPCPSVVCNQLYTHVLIRLDQIGVAEIRPTLIRLD